MSRRVLPIVFATLTLFGAGALVAPAASAQTPPAAKAAQPHLVKTAAHAKHHRHHARKHH